LDSAKLVDVTSRFYDALLEPTLWKPAFAGLCEVVGAAGGGIQIRGWPGADGAVSKIAKPRSTYICSHGLDPHCAKVYQEHYFQRDPWLSATGRHDVGQCYLSRQLIDESALKQTEFYNDLCRPFDFADWLGGLVLYEAGKCWIRLGLVARSFGDEELKVLRRIMPHLSRCVGIYRRMSAVSADSGAFEGAIDRLPCGVLFLDSQSRVVRANLAGERTLNASDALTVDSGVLIGVGSDAKRELTRAIAKVVHGHLLDSDDCRCIRLPRGTGRASVIVLVAPARGTGVEGMEPSIRCVVYVIDPAQSTVPSETRLCDLFALTPAEARLAVGLSQGMVPKEVAGALGLSWNTVRVQLRQVFAKTGTDRQATLVKLLDSVGMVASASRGEA
jgi:DNA-binding CsgD family transcriptional regulator/PAS domain-containing protein